MERTMSSKAGLGSRKRHTAEELERKYERCTPAPAPIEPWEITLMVDKARQMRGLA